MGTAVAAMLVNTALAAGSVAIAALTGLQIVWLRRPPVPAKVLGLRQLFLGLAVVAATTWGVVAS